MVKVSVLQESCSHQTAEIRDSEKRKKPKQTKPQKKKTQVEVNQQLFSNELQARKKEIKLFTEGSQAIISRAKTWDPRVQSQPHAFFNSWAYHSLGKQVSAAAAFRLEAVLIYLSPCVCSH